MKLDHLAGRLGVGLFRALIDRGAVTGGDGRHRVQEARTDRLLTQAGERGLRQALGLRL